MKKLMNEPMKKILDDLRARQLAGEHMPCPRCGYNNMREDLGTHTKSRHADAYICDDCVESEVGLERMNVPIGVWAVDWACFKYGIQQGEQMDQTIKEIQERLEGGEVEHLLDFVWAARNQDEADRYWAQLETMRKCPGVSWVGGEPGSACFAASDGEVIVHFRWRDGKLEYAISARHKSKLDDDE